MKPFVLWFTWLVGYAVLAAGVSTVLWLLNDRTPWLEVFAGCIAFLAALGLSYRLLKRHR